MATSPETPPFNRDANAHELAREIRRLLGPHFRERRFARGELLWREGETSGMMVVLKKGRVKSYRLLPTGRAVTLSLFGPDDIFGFLPFLDGEPYPAYVQAVDEVVADVIPRSELVNAVRGQPDLALTLIRLLGQRLRGAFDLIQGLSTPNVRARVAAALLPLIPDAPDVPERPLLRLPVSALEFAGAIGVVPETFSRAITAMVDDGILERADQRRYRVLDRRALELAAVPPLS